MGLCKVDIFRTAPGEETALRKEVQVEPDAISQSRAHTVERAKIE